MTRRRRVASTPSPRPGTVGAVPTVLAPIVVSLDAQKTTSETTLRDGGPYVVVLTTALPDIPLTVVTTFVGARDVDTTIVDLTLGMRPHARTEPRTVPRDDVPVTHAHDRCLLEHAATVRSAVAHVTGGHATVDVSDAALAATSR